MILSEVYLLVYKVANTRLRLVVKESAYITLATRSVESEHVPISPRGLRQLGP